MTSPGSLSPRALMSLLANGAKAVDVMETALKVGLLDVLERDRSVYGNSPDASACSPAASISSWTAWRV